MNDVTIIDQFLNTFATYIDSGFGLLRGEVAFLTATLIVIDMTIAGLYWAMSHATGQGEDVIAKLLRKVLYVGAFAYIINNFNWLASIVFRSFAGLGITATGSTITMEDFLQPGRLAKAGLDAGGPIFLQLDDLMGFPEVFLNLDATLVLFLAVEQDLVPGRKGAGQRGIRWRQGAGSGCDRRYRLGPFRAVPSPS